MGYETSPFGDSTTAGSGNVVTTVNNHYGVRDTGKTVGHTDVHGFENQLSMDLDVAQISGDAFTLLAPKIPAGAHIYKVIAEVTEAFTVTGTSPTINVGTEGSENTNGIEITEAQAEAEGVYDITGSLQGTWAAPLAAETTVGLDMDGTTPALSGTAGKVRVVIYYDKV